MHARTYIALHNCHGMTVATAKAPSRFQEMAVQTAVAEEVAVLVVTSRAISSQTFVGKEVAELRPKSRTLKPKLFLRIPSPKF